LVDCAIRALCSFAIAALIAGCPRRDPPPVRPAPPLAADPEVSVQTMQVECDGMLSALATYRACENHEDEDREAIDAWIERAERDFASSRKANPEANAQKAIAGACQRATNSVKAANERCLAGPRPKQ
jgi:hypothetical protein